MQKALGLFLAGCVLTGCVSTPPPDPPKPRPASPVLIGTPTSQVVTPALQSLMDGQTNQQVLVRFTVKADGSVQSPEMAFSKLSPADTAAVLSAIGQWHFKPAVDGTQPVDRNFIYPFFFGPDAAQDRTRFFCHNEAEIYEPNSRCDIVTFGQWRIYRMNPVYPPELLSQRLAGSVTLSFNIGPHGQAVNPKVTASMPSDLFNAAALAAVKQWYFEPLKGKNGDGATQHVTVTVKFMPPSVPPTASTHSPPLH